MTTTETDAVPPLPALPALDLAVTYLQLALETARGEAPVKGPLDSQDHALTAHVAAAVASAEALGRIADALEQPGGAR